MSSKILQYIFLFVLISGHTLSVLSQTYPGIKKGKIEFLGDSAYALVKHKKKTGLYHVSTESFVVEPEQSIFQYSETYKYLFKIDQDGFVTGYDLNVGDSACFVAKTKNELTFVFQRTYDSDYGWRCIVPSSDTVYDTILEEQYCRPYFNLPNSGIKLIGNSFIVHEYKNKQGDPFAEPLKSKLDPTKDSVIVDLKSGSSEPITVYPPDIPAICKTGVKSILTDEWQIEPKYENIYVENGYLMCAFRKASDSQEEWAYFDIYKQEGDKIVPTEYMGITSNSDLPTHLFSPYALTVDKDSTFYYTKSGQGMGIISLFLFDNFYKPDYSKLTDGYWHFYNRTVFEPEYEFVHKIGNDYDYLTAYKDSTFEFVKWNKGDIRRDFGTLPIPFYKSLKLFLIDTYDLYMEYYIIDDQVYIDTCSKKICLKKIEEPEVKGKCLLTIEKINDSLIYIEYNVSEAVSSFPYLNIEGEDSLILNAKTGEYEAFYEPFYPGTYESGMFNLKTQQWIVEPTHVWVVKKDNGFLMAKPILNEDLFLQHYTYTFKNNDGSYAFKNIQLDDDYSNPQFAPILIPEFKAGNPYPINSYRGNTMNYYESNGSVGLIDMNNIEVLHEPTELLYHHFWGNGFLSIENGLVRIEINDVDTSFSLMACNQFDCLFKDRSYVVRSKTSDMATNLNYAHFTDETSGIETLDAPSINRLLSQHTKGDQSAFFVSKLNDSLVYIEDWLADYNFSPPLSSKEYPDNDSLDVNGLKVYPQPKQSGYSHSGVYDYVNQKWFIPARYQLVLPYHDQYIAFLPFRGVNQLVNFYLFDIFDANGEIVVRKKGVKWLPPEYTRFLYETPELKDIFMKYED